MNSFVWHHPAAVEGNRWESVSTGSPGKTVDHPPKCLYDVVDNPGVKTMHVYLRNTKAD